MNSLIKLQQNQLPYQGKLTLSAGVITDTVRAAGVEGDGGSIGDGVGVWPAATNLCANGGAETNNTGWTTGGVNPNPERSSDRAKFGSYSLKCGGGAGISLASYPITYAGAGTYTCSAWVYIPSDWDGGFLSLSDAGLYAGSTTGDFNTTSTVGSWVRLYFTHTVVAGDLAGALRLYTSAGSASNKYVYMDGFQVETGSIATPYIETDGGTASRVAGTITAPGSIVNGTQGWAWARCSSGFGNSAEPSVDPGIFSIGDANEHLRFLYLRSTNSITCRRTGGGVTGGNTSAALALSVGDDYSAGFYWTSGIVGQSANGGTWNTASNTTVATLGANVVYLGEDIVIPGRPLHGAFYWAAFGRGLLTNADAALFHAWGNNRPLAHMFPRSADVSALMHFYGDGTAYRWAA